FSGISGAPADGMFGGTFAYTGLTGSIPENLFSGITGAPAPNMFESVFAGCRNLTGSIPGNLFAGIRGAPAEGMFAGTFTECTNLTDPIPSGLFSGIVGAPAAGMFSGTFALGGFTGPIPSGLFSGISGAPANSMFEYTFGECYNLTGSIPENLFAGISGEPASWMFNATFAGDRNLSGYIPAKLFSGIYQDPNIEDYGMDNVFVNSGLATSCPQGTINYTTGFENYFNDKVACQLVYNITYELDGGTNYSNAPTTYTAYGENILLGNPTKDGFIFAGWYDNSEYSGKVITDIPNDVSGNVTLYAKWAPNVITCDSGSYLPAGATECQECESGYYCVGDEFDYDENTSSGLTKCPTEYELSDPGAYSETQCYKNCAIESISHAMSVIGKDYYGIDTIDTCTIEACEEGWHTKIENNDKIICEANIININWMDASTESLSNGAGQCTYGGDIITPSVAPFKKGYTFRGWKLRQTLINLADYYLDETPDLDAEHISWSQLSSTGYTTADEFGKDNSVGLNPGEWWVKFSNGTLKGKGICANNQGTWATAGTPQGVGGQYCWCGATSYDVGNKGSFVNVSSPSLVSGTDYGDADSCARNCAGDCTVVRLRSDFRSAVFGVSNN
nr:InlB B-repeat-containing protein [Candidatus Enterousia merdequi]